MPSAVVPQLVVEGVERTRLANLKDHGLDASIRSRTPVVALVKKGWLRSFVKELEARHSFPSFNLAQSGATVDGSGEDVEVLQSDLDVAMKVGMRIGDK